MHCLKNVLLVPITAMLLTGCAWVHQDATFYLTTQSAVSNIGNGTRVAVRVLDRRPNPVIGYRGIDSKHASITTKQDLAALFQRKIVEGLTRKGFRAVSYVDEPAGVLTVELRQLDYTTDMEFWKGTVQTTCALRVVTSKGGITFDQTYIGAHKESAVEAPGAKSNNRMISAAMSAAVQRIFEDERLAAFLAN